MSTLRARAHRELVKNQKYVRRVKHKRFGFTRHDFDQLLKFERVPAVVSLQKANYDEDKMRRGKYYKVTATVFRTTGPVKLERSYD